MDPIEIFKMAISTIKNHKLRSMLTTLGVLIGVGAVLMNVAMIEGFDEYFQEEILDIGGNLIQVRAEGAPGEEEHFDEHLFDSLRRQPHLDGAAAFRSTSARVSYRGEEETVMVRGVEEGFFEASDISIIEGSGISPSDRNLAVIDSDLAQYSFSRQLKVRSTISIDFRVDGERVTREFRVKGISETAEEDLLGGGGLEVVNIPISTFNEITGEEGYSTIRIYAESSERVDTVKWNTAEIIDRQWGLRPIREIERRPEREGNGGGLFGEEGIGRMEEEFERMLGERDEYSIITAQEILDFSREISSTIGVVFIGVASISLLVGGIGIANIMLVTVKERTREIGVMKAVGAKNRDILVIFLLEAGLIGLIGGVIGLILAFVGTATVIPVIMGFPGIMPTSWIGISLGISFAIGVLSGLYPAWNASRMDPVQALSYE